MSITPSNSYTHSLFCNINYTEIHGNKEKYFTHSILISRNNTEASNFRRTCSDNMLFYFLWDALYVYVILLETIYTTRTY
jgi:hypothetical protein